MRKVFLDDLPRKSGSGANKGKDVVDWLNSIGCVVKFIYDEIEDEIKIIDYDSKTQYLKIKYKDVGEFKIITYGLQRCSLGKLLKKWNGDYRFEINDILKDDKRDLTIIDREKRFNTREFKYYRCKCSVCGYDSNWIEEHHLIGLNRGCSCCANKTVVEGINDIPTTAPWMVKYFQGGYDEAKRYTKSSSKKVKLMCPYCTELHYTSIQDLYSAKKLKCYCQDGISYPEKFVFSLLKQLNVNFITQLSKRNFEWCGKYYYDFYIPDYSIIIETHGIQHYRENSNFKQSLLEVKENDRIKKELALKNNIKEDRYIILDCQESNLDYIKNSILNSNILNILGNRFVDFKKCDLYGIKNICKEVCDYWNNKKEAETTIDLAGIFNIDRQTIIGYLKKGDEIGWCNYNPKEEMSKNCKNNTMKKVYIYKNNILIKSYDSVKEAGEKSYEYGLEISPKMISYYINVRKGIKKEYLFSYKNTESI